MANELLRRSPAGELPIQQAVLEAMGAGVLVVTVAGEIEYLNPSAERMFGLNAREAQGRPLRDFVQPADLMDRLSVLRTNIVNQGGWDGELTLTRHGHEEFTVRCSAFVLPGADGETRAVGLVAEELHHDNRTEAALLEALQQFHALAEATPSWVRLAWRDGAPVWYNRWALDFAGLSYKELETRGWRTLIHPEDRGLVPPDDVDAPWEAEIRMRRHDGEHRWLLVRSAPVFDGRGRVTGSVGIATDIHDRKTAESMVADARATMDAIWENTPIGLGLLDEELKWVRVNRAMAAMGRVTAQDWVGKRPEEVMPELADRIEEFRQVLAQTGGKPIVRRERERVIDGETFFRLDSWIPMRDDDGHWTSVAVVCEDVTPERRAQQAAEDALRELAAIYQHAPIGLAVIDSEMRSCASTTAWPRSTEYRPQSTLGGAPPRSPHVATVPRRRR